MDATHHSQPGSSLHPSCTEVWQEGEADPTEGKLSPQMGEADLAHTCQWAGEPWKTPKDNAGAGDKVLKH